MRGCRWRPQSLDQLLRRSKCIPHMTSQHRCRGGYVAYDTFLSTQLCQCLSRLEEGIICKHMRDCRLMKLQDRHVSSDPALQASMTRAFLSFMGGKRHLSWLLLANINLLYVQSICIWMSGDAHYLADSDVQHVDCCYNLLLHWLLLWFFLLLCTFPLHRGDLLETTNASQTSQCTLGGISC